MTKNPYHAYHKAAHTVSKTKQVVMLYDGVIRNLQQARAAIEQGEIETRYNKLVRASEIIIGLQSCLDFDEGADAAQILFDFYSSFDMRIAGLHRSNSLTGCDELIEELKSMREMWDRFDRGVADGNEGNAQRVPVEYDASTSSSAQEEPVATPISGSVTLSA